MFNLVSTRTLRSFLAKLFPADQSPARAGAWGCSSPGADFALPLVELHEPPVSPFFQPVKVPLDGSTTFWSINHSSQFCVISRLAEGTLCPIIQIINEGIKQDWNQYWPLGYTTSQWPPTRLHATDPGPSHSVSFQSTSLSPPVHTAPLWCSYGRQCRKLYWSTR